MKEREYPQQQRNTKITKPKPTTSSTKAERIGSKTAPIEYQMDFDLMEYGDEQFEEYIHSYNYYIYYLSIKPRDPRLPKPLYKPTPDLDFIKSGILCDRSDEIMSMTLNNELRNSNQNFSGYIDRSRENQRESDRVENKNHLQKIEFNSSNMDKSSEYNKENFSFVEFSKERNKVDKDYLGFVSDFIGAADAKTNVSMTNNYLNLIINNFDKNIQICPYPNEPQKVATAPLDFPEYIPHSYKFQLNTFNEQQHEIDDISETLENQVSYKFQNYSGPNPYQNYFDKNLNLTLNPNKINYTNQFNQNADQKYSISSFHDKKQQDSRNNYKILSYKPTTHNGYKKQDQHIGTNELSKDLSQIIKNIDEYCKDHSGSRIIQKRFEDGSDQDKISLMEAIIPHVYTLSKDVFGNYVIQKFLEYSVKFHTTQQIIKKLEGKIEELTFHMYGCRVIQKSIDIGNTEEVKKVFYEIQNCILKCIEDQNGNHVIQKLIDRLTVKENREIIKIIQEKSLQIVTHQYGCRVIQKVLDNNNSEECQVILNQILKASYKLSQDQYGNYAIQHIIENPNPQDIWIIYNELKEKIFELSLHKYTSNVIEKLLEYGNNIIRKNIIDAIILKDDEFSDSLLTMVRDKYGNYVVQKLIEVADFKTKENIVRRIINSQSLKKRDGFSKHVISFIEKMGFSFPHNNKY